MVKKLTEILIAITAKTPDELSRKMFENNIKYSKWFYYTDPTFSDKQWISWFSQDIELEVNDNLTNITPINQGANKDGN